MLKRLKNKIEVFLISFANTFHREAVVLRTCDYHLQHIQEKTELPIWHPLMQDLVLKCEELDLDQRGPFLAYVTVLLERQETLQQATSKAHDWAWRASH